MGIVVHVDVVVPIDEIVARRLCENRQRGRKQEQANKNLRLFPSVQRTLSGYTG